jgi:glucose/mannose transport system permease protein
VTTTQLDGTDLDTTRKPQVSRTGGSRASAGSIIRYGLLILSAVIVLVPVYVLLVTSIKDPSTISTATAWDLPSKLSASGWASAIERLAPSMGRSLVLAICASVLSSILGAMNGFVFAKWKFPGSDIVFTVFLFGMFIPYQAVMIPLQAMLLNLPPGFDGIGKLIIVHTVYGIPICSLIFRNYYATAVPGEIIEAAAMDGAGMLRTFVSVVLPVSLPAFVVTLIWQFTSAWNDFLFALFLTQPTNGPVTYALQELAGGQNPNYAQIFAGVLIASLPTLVVYLLLGRWFIRGLMSGSVK